MKPLLGSFILFALITTLLPAAPGITIGELKFLRAYSPEDSKVDLREYLPEGETFDHWNRLASIRVFKDLKDPKQYLLNVAAAITRAIRPPAISSCKAIRRKSLFWIS